MILRKVLLQSKRKKDESTLERMEITSLSIILMQSINDSCTQSDLSTIPAMCRL